MFTSLPLPRGVDADELLHGYLVALEGLLPGALKAVVLHLVRGTWHEEVKFCPRPPELANMVRFEQRRVESISRPRLPAPATVPHEWKDWRQTHIDKAFSERRKFIEHVSPAQSHQRARQNRYPAGSMFLWSLGPADTEIGSIYGPPGSALSDNEIWGDNYECLPDSITGRVRRTAA
ncbi:hypothetical protein PH562_16660 [Rhizobium sp. CNPSo 4062]|uniref:hypothetical protein n=1 Tax=Rhizobium sp. CNPSo 4062 TaxID=3021410 RepID=UPI00254B4C34|nr:hypothetical protein [Rhizobium sp. CNPSo 4062]MDK4703885.1 hypothetical protein [Rhizobium sp. CNPSo 4062]